MKKITGLESALSFAEESKGKNMLVSANLVIDMAEQINHVDAPADALESIINMVEVTDQDEAKARDAAKAALTAYRGGV